MGSLFGGDDRNEAAELVARRGQQAQSLLSNFEPTGFRGGGLRSTLSGGDIRVTSSDARQQAVGGLASTFGDQASELANLRSQVEPGFGRLTSARLGEIENARRRSVGNLRENLARRRVLGSSFAQDAVTRSEMDFAQQAEQAAAESAMQELELTNQLINQEFEASRGEFQTQLDEMNLQADLASQLSQQATNVLSQLTQAQASAIQSNATAQAEMMQASEAGRGEALGQLGAGLGGAIGTAFGGPIGGSIGSSLGGGLGAAFS